MLLWEKIRPKDAGRQNKNRLTSSFPIDIPGGWGGERGGGGLRPFLAAQREISCRSTSLSSLLCVCPERDWKLQIAAISSSNSAFSSPSEPWPLAKRPSRGPFPLANVSNFSCLDFFLTHPLAPAFSTPPPLPFSCASLGRGEMSNLPGWKQGQRGGGTLSCAREQASNESSRMSDHQYSLLELVCGAGGIGQFAGPLLGGQQLQKRQSSILSCCPGDRGSKMGRALHGAAHPQGPSSPASQPRPSRRLYPLSHESSARSGPPPYRIIVFPTSCSADPTGFAGHPLGARQMDHQDTYSQDDHLLTQPDSLGDSVGRDRRGSPQEIYGTAETFEWMKVKRNPPRRTGECRKQAPLI